MNKQKLTILTKTSEAYNLWKLETTPERVFGGLLHEMWKITTSSWVYAVKLLNPEIMKRDEAYGNFVFSEKVSNIAKENGIPAIVALQNNDKVLEKIDDSYVMVFPWFEWTTLSTASAWKDACYAIGWILAHIHNLWIETTDATPHWKMEINGEYLETLENEFSGFSEIIQELASKYNDSVSVLNSDVVISHGDIDQKNVLWNEGKPVIIDWEASWPVNPMVELLTAWLYWWGIVDWHVDEVSFKWVITWYSQVRDIDYTHCEKHLYGCVWFVGWLMYNIERSLESTNDKALVLAKEEIVKTVEVIKVFHENFEKYVGWIWETQKS